MRIALVRQSWGHQQQVGKRPAVKEYAWSKPIYELDAMGLTTGEEVVHACGRAWSVECMLVDWASQCQGQGQGTSL